MLSSKSSARKALFDQRGDHVEDDAQRSEHQQPGKSPAYSQASRSTAQWKYRRGLSAGGTFAILVLVNHLELGTSDGPDNLQDCVAGQDIFVFN